MDSGFDCRTGGQTFRHAIFLCFIKNYKDIMNIIIFNKERDPT